MFEPSTYREIAAESIREYMQDREFSADPKIREVAHFEGAIYNCESYIIILRNVNILLYCRTYDSV